MANDEGKLHVKALTVKVIGKTFVVGSESQELVLGCGQNTARTFELPVDGHLPQLMADLKKALADLKALDKKKPARKEGEKE
ncbi:MAG TPA: hypothetical protein VLB76_16885 [Thermoanaerobaculia bacterium]|jgi:hypothetical protein|nr:hypothetical protein [Thermoanaerobaculia bacterium]